MMVKKATMEDFQIVSSLYLEFGETFGKPHLLAPKSNRKIVAEAASFLQNDDAVAFLLLDDNKNPCGLMMGFLESLFYSESLHAQDRVFYIQEGSRSLAGLRLLLDTFTQWAKDKGCFSVSLTALGSRNNETLVKWLTRQGYALEGYQCIKVL